MKLSEILKIADRRLLSGMKVEEDSCYLDMVPEMEAKLREMNRLLPDILETIEFAHSATRSGLYKEMFQAEIKKLEEWRK